MITSLTYLLVEARVNATAEIGPTISEALIVAKYLKCRVVFEFNGVKVTVGPESDVKRLAEAHQAEQRREKEVGP